MAKTSEHRILNALHYLFTHRDDKIVAHCLDLDLVTTGTTIEKAEERLNAVVLAQFASCYTTGNFAQLNFQAPAKYWDAMAKASELGKSHLEVEIPPVVLPVERSVVTLSVFRGELAKAA